MIVRFRGGPLDGEERELEDGMTSTLVHAPIAGRPNRVIAYGLAGADVGQEGAVFVFVPVREVGDIVSAGESRLDQGRRDRLEWAAEVWR